MYAGDRFSSSHNPYGDFTDIGVDVESRLLHTVTTTEANVAHTKEVGNLLHGWIFRP